MTALHSFAYAQARAQARYGDRLEDSDWQRLGAVRSVNQYLETARATSLGPWVAPLSQDMDHHQKERVLRAVWRDTVDEVSGWMPTDWQEAARLWTELPDLPSVVHVQRGWFAPEWAERDDHLAEALPEAAGESEQNAGAAWLTRWRSAWANPSRAQAEALEAIATALFPGFDATGVPVPAAAYRAGEAAIDAELTRLFRRHAQTPVAIFAYLAFTWRDFERFRGGLIRRQLFHDGRERSAA
ncbi:hypothetical protein [Dichotomicrobium thermohalophilum]|uniref:Uncharacterized protein n=1 Tax=Dichotomicrobium thermohalophilum TaxID=933063 RepID=A0A397Q525_9HYPH|nr:hypothetical protein [Dichotomicrobium thermohalophilum]RIA56148.1 hypothetical protein BXY53_1249 [Dichotomicrobium thermohalophilum]